MVVTLSAKKLLMTLVALVFLTTVYYAYSISAHIPSYQRAATAAAEDAASGGGGVDHVLTAQSLGSIRAHFVVAQPVDGDFGELGRGVQLLRGYVERAEGLAAGGRSSSGGGGGGGEALMLEVEKLALAMFPWLTTPSSSSSSSSREQMPFRALRRSFVPGSRGIVIPVGAAGFRFAAHLITCLREVLRSELPIQVAFAGDADLSREKWERLLGLGRGIELLDVSAKFEDYSNLLQLAGSWAIKSFAILASSFEQVILLDADAVFLKDPSVLFEYPGYSETGALLFHDRLLWQNVFRERQDWWRTEMLNHTPSATMQKSLVYTKGFAEEADSGAMVFDKSRLGIVTALLHVCWQNTKLVRDAYTYRLMYGDKESYWLGLELSGVDYTFEEHYGAIVGHKEPSSPKVCSYTIAHPSPASADDEDLDLLWYNGSLLKNKSVNSTEFEVPEWWMLDGTWEKGMVKEELSCMKRGKIRKVSEEQSKIIKQSVDAAKSVDRKLVDIIED